MMTESIVLAAVLLAGVIVGLMYFVALWAGLNHALKARHPVRILMISFLLRASAALAVFYALMSGRALYLAIALLGFLVGRQLVHRWVKNRGNTQNNDNISEVISHGD